jgi:hypothetical protein
MPLTCCEMNLSPNTYCLYRLFDGRRRGYKSNRLIKNGAEAGFLQIILQIF